ncbi:SusC/RagA family TonB-linked outer membrane protein [Sphingobacterium kyonggiense]
MIRQKVLMALHWTDVPQGRTLTPLYRTILIMKLTVFLILFFMFQASADIFGQSVSLNMKNQRLDVVLKEIQKQTGHSFLINSAYLKKANAVSINIQNKSIKATLDEIFNSQPFGYVISNNVITVNPNSIDEVPQIKISGSVHRTDGSGIAGVSVTEVSSGRTTQTNVDGSFTLDVKSSDSNLKFSFLGYTTQTKAASQNMKVTLVAEDKEIDEVVVTGFQTVDKSKFVGSVSQVDKKVIDRSGSIDVSRMLQGAAAGVSVQSTSGTFGSTPKIRIRGNSSISANQEPLYVINGVPITSPSNVSVSQLYSGDPASVLSSAIAGLNAQDIEDIQILKDGSATALYGTRAANGVILIKTKKGSYNSRNINLSTAYSIGVKPNVNQFNLMNSNQEMKLYKEMYDRGYLSNANWPSSTGAFTETYKQLALRNYNLEDAYAELNTSAKANTDWFDVLFRNNLIQEHGISFSGGGEKNTYYASGSYSKDDGQAIGFNLDRFTADLRTTLKITSGIDLDVNVNWSNRNQRTPGTYNAGTSYSDINRQFEINPFLYAMNTSRAMYPYNPDGSYKYYTENLAPFNILEELNENFNDIRAQEIRGMLRPTIKLFRNLTYEGTFAIRKANNSYNHTVTERSNVANAHRVDYNDVLRQQNGLLYQDPNDAFGYRETFLPEGGFIFKRSNWMNNWNMRNQLNFSDKFNDHRLDLSVGADMEDIYIDRDYTKGTGYLYYAGGIISPSRLAMIRAVNLDDRTYISSFERLRKIGYYSFAQYTYKDRYNLGLSGRVDGSNIFGRMTRSKFLPNYSVGVAWNIDRENFIQNSSLKDKIDFLKIRASYALRGNQFETSPMLDANYVNLTRLDAANNAKGISVLSPELFNLNWEKDYTSNFGFDIGLFNKLSLTAEYYYRENKDLVTSPNIAQEEGFTTKRINFGSMVNEGVDVTIGLKNILNKENFIWDANLIYGYVKNSLKNGELQSSLLTQITRSTGYALEGYPLEGLFAFRYAGLGTNGQPYFYKGDELVDGITSSERDRSLVEYMGSRQPLGTGSFASTMSYKGLEFRVFLTYAYGHKVFIRPAVSRFYDDASSKSGDMNYRWETIGDEQYTNIPGLISTIERIHLGTVSNIDDVAYNRSNFRVAKADNLRINEIQLSYDIGRIINKQWPAVKNSRIMFSANNIHYWTSGRLRGVDPELYLNGGTSLPNPRSYTVRLTLGF